MQPIGAFFSLTAKGFLFGLQMAQRHRHDRLQSSHKSLM
jgi:hypothetical protein